MPNDRKEYYHNYYLKNKAEKVIYSREYYKTHKEANRIHNRRYKKKHKIAIKIKKAMKWPMWKVRQELAKLGSEACDG